MAQFDVTGPDGKTHTVQAPEGATEDDARAYVAQTLYPNYDPSKRTFGEKAKGLGKSVEEGITRAVMGTMALPRTAAEMMEAYRPTPPDQRPNAFLQWPSAEDFRRSYEGGSLFGKPPPRYEPAGLPERAAETVGEFLPGTGGRTAGGILSRTLRVAGPAIGSEVGGETARVISPQHEPSFRLGGALIGGGVQGLVDRPSAVKNVLDRALSGVTEQHVDQAAKLMQDASSSGINLTWPEALSKVTGRPVGSDLIRHLEASPQTDAKMAEFFANRTGQVESAVKQQTGQIAGGPAASPATIGPAVGEAAYGAARDIERQRTALVDPLYKAAETQHVPHPEIQQVVKGIDNAIAADKTGVVGKALKEFRDILVESPATPGTPAQRIAKQTPAGTIYTHIPAKPGTPESYITDIGNLDRARKYIRDKTGMPQIGGEAITKEQGKVIQDSLDDLESRMTASSPMYAAAKSLYQRATEQVVKPQLQGTPLGKLADRDLETKQAIDTLFPRAPLANSENEISAAVGKVANKNAGAANQLVRNYLETSFNTAAKDLVGGPVQSGGARFRAMIAGNNQQAKNLQAAVEALPGGQQTWQGLSRLLDVMEATGTRQNVGSRTAYNIEALKEFQPGGIAQTGAKIIAKPLEALRPINDAYTQFSMGRNMDKLANILTDPKSADMLRKIAASPKGGDRELNLIRALVYANQLTPRQ
jgi:hypothetical protein